MAVRLNLLAEALDLAEQRRRDPVKRAFWVGGFVVALTLLWYLSLFLNTWRVNAELANREARWKTIEKDYQRVAKDKSEATALHDKLLSLHALASNRFLLASPLNALQHAIVKVEDVQVTRLRLDQNFVLTPGTKAVTNSNKKVTAAKPAYVTDKRLLLIEARDFSQPQGSQVSAFKSALYSTPYFQQQLGSLDDIRMTGLARQTDPNEANRVYVTFTLECRFPDITREAGPWARGAGPTSSSKRQTRR